MNELLHPLTGHSRKISLIAALFILIAVPITVLAGLNYSPRFTRAAECFDVTGEGTVDSKDSEAISDLINENSFKTEADVNGDGRVNQDDSNVVKRHQNEVCAPEVTFFADPKTIPAGGTSTLRWSVRHGETISIFGFGEVGNEGERQLTPNENTTYTMKVTGPAGSVTAFTRVEIQP